METKSKPKARRAVLEHNLQWFNHYIWGDARPEFVDPAVPRKSKDEKATSGLTGL